MGWKEREREIRGAMAKIKRHQAQYGKKGTRIHEWGMLERAAVRKALEFGPCRICQSLEIENKREGPSVIVSLRCRQGLSPLGLHRPFVTKLGEIPDCKFIIPFEQDE